VYASVGLLWALRGPPVAGVEPTSEAPAAAVESDESDESDDVRIVRVESRRADGLTASARTIGSRTIANTPKRSAEDLLRLVPGLVIVQHGSQGKGYQFYLRGFDALHGSDIETRVNDIPVNEASNVHAHGYLDLAWIPPEVVATIDARKGSVRVDQGNFGTAATIDYTLGVPVEQRGFRASYEAGTTNRHRGTLVLAPRRLPESSFLVADVLYDAGYGENRKIVRAGGLGQLRLWSRGGAHIDGFAGVYAARFGLPGTVRLDDWKAGRIGFADAYIDNTSGESQRVLLGLRAGIERSNTRIDVTAYGLGRRLMLDENYTGFQFDPVYGDRHLQRQDAASLGVRGHLRQSLHPQVDLLVHASWQGDLIEQSQDPLDEQARPTPPPIDPAERGADLYRDLSIHQNAWGLAAGLRTTPVRWLLLEGGVRLDVFHDAVDDRTQSLPVQRGTFWAISPRLAMQARAGRKVQLFAAYGRGLRSPEARSLTSRGPQENENADDFKGTPSMSLSDNVEIGARVQPDGIFDIGASLFGIWIARESLFDHASGVNIEQGPTRRLGIEADVQVHAASWLDLGFDFTAVHGRFRTTGDPIPGAPPLLVSTFGTLQHPIGIHAGWRWWLLGPRPLAYGARAGIVTVLDLAVGYRYKWFGIDVNVDNVLGLKWREGEYSFPSQWDRSRPRSGLGTLHYIAGYPIGGRFTLSATF